MDRALRDAFVDRWRTYFGAAELPIAFYYTDAPDAAPAAPPATGHRCVIGLLGQVRSGRTLRVDSGTAGCGGARRYLGFSRELAPHFEYFLSCGLPGTVEGERYKKTPALVQALLARSPEFAAPARFLVFKRWDMLEAADDPDVVIFFACPDVLAGLFTLANFDEVDSVVATPFAAGCGTIIQHPYLEARTERPRAILGMFDVSARPFVPAETLTFAVPLVRFQRMVANMDESFLITPSWEKVRKRLQ